MAKINLLPWREELRQERLKQFTLAVISGAVLAVLVLFLVTSFANGLIDEQTQRNGKLQTEIAKLDVIIREIQDIETQRDRLIARMQVIEELQLSRPKVVRVFDSLVRSVPEGIHLDSMSRLGNRLELQGVAQSNPRVSVFMRQLDSDEEFSESKLRIVQRTSAQVDAIRKFTLEVDESKPVEQEEIE